MTHKVGPYETKLEELDKQLITQYSDPDTPTYPRQRNLEPKKYATDTEDIPRSVNPRRIRWERKKKIRRDLSTFKRMVYGVSLCERLDTLQTFRELDSLFPEISNKKMFSEVAYAVHENENVFFIFDFGVLVFWGFTRNEAQVALEKLRKFFQGNDQNETEFIAYTPGDSFKIWNDEVILETDDIMEKLAVSYAMAQSIQLSVYEKAIEDTIDSTVPIREELISKGSISLSQTSLTKMIAQLFQQRAYINLHSELLGTPDAIWNYDELKRTYDKVRSYFEMKSRISVLNHRLDLVQSLLDLFNDLLTAKHETRLEWIVIYLICCEVLIAVVWDIILKGIFKLF